MASYKRKTGLVEVVQFRFVQKGSGSSRLLLMLVCCIGLLNSVDSDSEEGLFWIRLRGKSVDSDLEGGLLRTCLRGKQVWLSIFELRFLIYFTAEY